MFDKKENGVKMKDVVKMKIIYNFSKLSQY